MTSRQIEFQKCLRASERQGLVMLLISKELSEREQMRHAGVPRPVGKFHLIEQKDIYMRVSELLK